MRDVKLLTAALFRPSGSLSGNESPSVYRGENMILRGGLDGLPYFENFTGNKDLGENYDLDALQSDGVTPNYKLTGTITFIAGSPTIAGAGTDFIAELHYGQKIFSGTEVFVVKEVLSPTNAKAFRAPATTAAAQTAYRMPELFDLNRKRGVQLTGNAIEIEKGHIISVGSGELYVNGAVLPGTSLVASNQPQAAIYRANTFDYVVRPLGFDNTPPKPEINMTGGGTKGMTDGNKFSFMVSYWAGTPEGTGGFSNPCDVIKLDGASAPLQINIAGSKTRFEFDFTASLAGIPSNAQGFVIYSSLSGKKTVTTGGTTTITNPNETNYENGPWYRVQKVKLTDLDGANKIIIEFLDSDVYELVTGNNFPPPNCEFVAKVEGRPMYISAYGKRRAGGKDDGDNPGPVALLSKSGNADGVPPEWYASLKDIIIGWFEGVGRWFLMTPSSLDFVVPTGLVGSSIQGGSNLEIPLLARPYWQTGAANRYSITLVDDTLYGVSGSKFFRSIGNGDENVQKYDFGKTVEDITRSWNAGHVHTIEDKKNSQVLFIHSGAYKNNAGFWVSEILPFSLRNAWMPKIILSDIAQDMIISGVANINERVEFLAGGRKAGGGFEVRTYQFDEKTDGGVPIPYYLLWQISDDGLENRSKAVHSIRLDARVTQFYVQLHGCRPGGEIVVSDMENGTNALSSNITFPDSAEVKRYLPKKLRYKNLAKYTIRAAGVWSGSGAPDRLEEIALEVSAHGRPR